MNYIIYLVYPALIALLVVGMKISKRGEWNEEFMSLKQTKYLQGFTALLIMFHHLGQKTCAPWHEHYVIVHGLDLFVPYGFYFVSIFLFCSGYGLYKSVTTKEGYLKGFFVKRVLPIIITYYTVNIIFLIVRYALGEHIRTQKLILYLTGALSPNPNAWFVEAAPLFYMLFFLCFKFIKNQKAATIATCIGMLAYIILGTYFRHNDYFYCGEWWYESAPFFVFGMLVSRHEKRITDHIKKFYLLYLILTFVLIFVLGGMAKWAQGAFSYYYGEYTNVPVPRFDMMWRKWVTLLAEVAADAAFVFFIFIAMLKVKIGNRILGFMGTITLEFYMIHGLFVELFGYDFADELMSIKYIRNPALHFLITIVCSIPAAYLLKLWIDLFRKLGKRKEK